MAISNELAKRIQAFARVQAAAPFWWRWGRFRLPAGDEDLQKLLKSLNRFRELNGPACDRIEAVDLFLGKRLAADPLFSTQLLELKLQWDSGDKRRIFDEDAHRISRLINSIQDTANASCLGLAFAVIFFTTANAEGPDSQATQTLALQEVHSVFSILAKQSLIENRMALAFCQSFFIKQVPNRTTSEVQRLHRIIRQPRVLLRVLQMTPSVHDCALIISFIEFLMEVDEDHKDLDFLEFVDRLASYGQPADAIVQIAKIQASANRPVEGLNPIFSRFRFPRGLSRETAGRLRESRSLDELQRHLHELLAPCKGGKLTHLSPCAQMIASLARRAVAAECLTPAEFAKLDSQILWLVTACAGIDLHNRAVQSQFVGLFYKTKHVRLVLSESGRGLVARKLRQESARTSWIVAVLLEAIGKFSPEQYSMISTCLNSGYLFDTAGNYCNAKTFRDFQSFIDQDLMNLLVFLEPNSPRQATSTGHVNRLISFIRDFLVDPENAHYTNFEIQRTKQHTDSSAAARIS